jgi:hypothetical protein
MIGLRRVDSTALTLVGTFLSLIAWTTSARADSLTIFGPSQGIRNVHFRPPPGSESLNEGPFPYMIISGDTRSEQIFDAALEFNISAIPLGVTITHADLTISIAGAASTLLYPGSVDLFSYMDTDGIVELSDFHQPTTSIGGTGPLPNSDGPSDLHIPFTFDITSLIATLTAQNDQFVGFYLRPLAEVETFESVWGSLAALSDQPRLDISFVPEPSSALMLGIAIIGLLALVYHRRSIGRVTGASPRNGKNCTLSRLAKTELASQASFASSAGD